MKKDLISMFFKIVVKNMFAQNMILIAIILVIAIISTLITCITGIKL